MSSTVTSIDYSYEPFSREQEYVELNEKFVASLPLWGRRRVLDLACGTGTLTAMIADALAVSAPTGPIWIAGLDLAPEAFAHARAHLATRVRPNVSFTFVRGSAAAIPLIDGAVDTVAMGNAIQLLDDKEQLVREVSRVLIRGGLFAFNTSFYAGSYVETTERFYLRWVQEAVNSIRRLDASRRSRGEPGITRTKGLARPAFSQRWLSASEYAALLGLHGLRVIACRERTVMLTERCFASIGSYAGLANVLLSGYPIDIACDALRQAVRPALAASGLEAIPRKWIELAAVKEPVN